MHLPISIISMNNILKLLFLRSVYHLLPLKLKKKNFHPPSSLALLTKTEILRFSQVCFLQFLDAMKCYRGHLVHRTYRGSVRQFYQALKNIRIDFLENRKVSVFFYSVPKNIKSCDQTYLMYQKISE